MCCSNFLEKNSTIEILVQVNRICVVGKPYEYKRVYVKLKFYLSVCCTELLYNYSS